MYVFIIKFGWLGGRLLGGGCSLDLLCVFRVCVCVPGCRFGFSRLGFWCGSFFLIAPFPGRCLLVLFSTNLQNCAVKFCRLVMRVQRQNKKVMNTNNAKHVPQKK